jgi:ceramide glucosyltransferase
MLLTVIETLAAASVATSLTQGTCAWRTLKRGRRVGPPTRGYFPPVSILKPLKGMDDGLMDNLESFCAIDYPAYEIVFCLQSASDPALRVARKVMERHPERDIRIILGEYLEGVNPKINNLIPGFRVSRHPFVLVSDSNVRVRPDYLREAVSHFEKPGVGMVNHLVRGTGARAFGARLENGHLNTFILGSISMLDGMLDMPCVVGKSMLMRRSDLEEVGGLESVKDYLAEDYVLGRRFREAGKRVIISGAVVDNVNAWRGVRDFVSRHARWNRMRASIAGPAYAFEILANPVAFAPFLVAAGGGSAEGWAAAGAVTGAKLAVDAAMGRALGDREAAKWVLLGPLRDLLAAGVWVSGLFSRTVTWRGRTLRIARGSRLVPVEVHGPGGRVDAREVAA